MPSSEKRGNIVFHRHELEFSKGINDVSLDHFTGFNHFYTSDFLATDLCPEISLEHHQFSCAKFWEPLVRV
jgi:hypothetical protein